MCSYTTLGTPRLQSQRDTRSGTSLEKWHTPLEVAHATRSGTRLEVAYALRNARAAQSARHLKWHATFEVARHALEVARHALEVAYATQSGTQLEVAYATRSGMEWHEVAKSKSTTCVRSLRRYYAR